MATKGSRTGVPRLDEIGRWSEIKLEVVRKYAQAYANILAASDTLRFSYIDGFAGAGFHLSQASHELVPGSPLNALAITPRFNEYFLVDTDPEKVRHLLSLPEVKDRADVHVIHGDCNEVLPDQVFPKVEYKDYRRALCVLDPYGLQLHWGVVETAGKMGSIDILLNFPMMGMNREALWLNPDRATPEARARMTALWGDDSWMQVAYRELTDLFGERKKVKVGNEEIVKAFAERLRIAGGFKFVSRPLPMKNSMGSIVYYLFLASQKEVAARIFNSIARKYTNTR